MNDLTYVEPQGLPDNLAAGTTVEVCDRSGTAMGTTTVSSVTPLLVKTKCGRTWDRRGWWVGSQPYPFPFIRVA